MAKYDEKGRESSFAEYAIARFRGSEKAGAAAVALLSEFADLCARTGVLKTRVRAETNTLVVEAPAGGKAVAIETDRDTGDLKYMRGTSVLGSVSGLRFNPTTELFEGTGPDPASREVGYKRPQRSALAVLTDDVLKNL
jgi:hypothetical protein